MAAVIFTLNVHSCTHMGQHCPIWVQEWTFNRTCASHLANKRQGQDICWLHLRIVPHRACKFTIHDREYGLHIPTRKTFRGLFQVPTYDAGKAMLWPKAPLSKLGCQMKILGITICYYIMVKCTNRVQNIWLPCHQWQLNNFHWQLIYHLVKRRWV